MKRYFSLLIVLLILASMTGCGTNESKDTIATTQPTNIESNNTSLADFTYVNEKYGFSLVFPGYWKDQYNIEDVNGVGVRIHHKPTWLKKGGGTLFQVTLFDKSTEY